MRDTKAYGESQRVQLDLAKSERAGKTSLGGGYSGPGLEKGQSSWSPGQ